jgi:hypothetical protein
MPMFYLHIVSGALLTEDEEGDELPTPNDARLKALASVREIVGAAIHNGVDPDIDGIVVANAEGHTLFTVTIAEALPPRLRR